MNKKLKMIIGGLIILITIITLFATISSQNITYYYRPGEVIQSPENFNTRKIRVMGLVQSGSVDWKPEKTELNFRISDDGRSYLNIVYVGAKPDMFREKQGIIVEGTMASDTDFVATTLLIKHNEEYKVNNHKKDKEDYYETVIE
ncbi:MAG: cytochrome c maturation protein CcmE [Deltaproteobacteria bacterium]|jgi:cytochrome c-type biogenesis protein CcmE|nr:cytochrome c maturation protein CcmE [Deltaproteobacteria bacterium]MBT4526990.1 cytochrome c maturation protein CcmE [Deltaproteobacteria bacterium]